MIEKIEKPITPLELNNKVNEIIDGLGNAGKELFDIVQKDHILSYEETEGYELLGNYVYKEAIAGSRYGYPDFYNKVVEEYNNATENTFKKHKSSNITNNGVIDKAGVLSGFSANNYAKAFASVSKMELVVKFTMGENNTTQQAIVGVETIYDGMTMYLLNGYLTVYISSNGTSWNVASKVAGSHLFIPYKTYLVKYKYIETGYHKFYISEDDGQTWTEDISISSSNLVFSGYHNLGIDSIKEYPFLGTIDLNGCYLIDEENDGRFNWQGCDYYEFAYKEHSNGHKFYDIANKETVDELYNDFGAAWFYGVDTANERICLPQNDYLTSYVANGSHSVIGNGITLGLTNGKTLAGLRMGAYSSYDTLNVGVDGYGTTVGTKIGQTDFTDGLTLGITQDAEKSGIVADITNSQNGLHLYMVVGNIVAESAVTDVVDVTTSENDTLPLFHNFWSKEDMTTTGCYVNASLGSFLSGNVYTTAYNTLVQKVGTGNVKSVSDAYTDYDFVVNADDMTFRLPLKNGQEVMFATGVRGNGIAIGFTNGTDNVGIYAMAFASGSTAASEARFNSSAYGTEINTPVTNTGGSAAQIANGVSLGITTDSSKSGIILDTENITIPDGWNLYYKVSNAVQNLELLDVAGITADLNRKVNINSDVIDGQWVASVIELSSETAIGTYEIDLSDYLPNDGYQYEIKIVGNPSCSGSTYSHGYLTDCLVERRIFNLGTANRNTTLDSVCIIGNNRKLIYEIRQVKLGGYDVPLTAIGYRRIGTNQ